MFLCALAIVCSPCHTSWLGPCQGVWLPRSVARGPAEVYAFVVALFFQNWSKIARLLKIWGFLDAILSSGPTNFGCAHHFTLGSGRTWSPSSPPKWPKMVKIDQKSPRSRKIASKVGPDAILGHLGHFGSFWSFLAIFDHFEQFEWGPLLQMGPVVGVKGCAQPKFVSPDPQNGGHFGSF